MLLLLILVCIAALLAVAEWPRIFVYHILLGVSGFRNRQIPEEPAPPPDGGWRDVLGLPRDEHRMALVKKAYRRQARMLHPDRGGSTAAMARLNEAYRMAKVELGQE